MYAGIPYFGIYNNEITENILNKEIDKEITVKSFYKFIESSYDKKLVAIIDGKWLTWLRDITFDYKHKQCYLPYYTYRLFNTNLLNVRTDNEGHLIKDGDTLSIRYEYNYERLDINLNRLCYNGLLLYDLDTNEKFILKTSEWLNETRFNIDKLYNLYIESCFKEDDYLVKSHLGGYHFIYRAPKAFKNRERELREQLDLNSYSENTINKFDEIYKDYRDVREYSYNELIQKVGLIHTNEVYSIRRLKFESYLFCIMRKNILSDNAEFNNYLARLGRDFTSVKYGDTIKLIFKSYWLDNYKPVKVKTWSRFNM